MNNGCIKRILFEIINLTKSQHVRMNFDCKFYLAAVFFFENIFKIFLNYYKLFRHIRRYLYKR